MTFEVAPRLIYLAQTVNSSSADVEKLSENSPKSLLELLIEDAKPSIMCFGRISKLDE